MVREEMDRKLAGLALRVLDECRVTLMMAFRFLDRALWKMPFEPVDEPWLLAADGRALRFNPGKVVACYRRDPVEMARAYLHSLLHCVLRNPSRTVRADPGAWSLACDICVEAIAAELCRERLGTAGDEMVLRVVGALEKRGVPITPAGIYRELLTLRKRPCDNALLMAVATDAAGENGLLFARDSHRLWNLVKPPDPEEGQDASPDGGERPDGPEDGGDAGKGRQDGPDGGSGNAGDGDADEDTGEPGDGSSADAPPDARPRRQEGARRQGGADDSDLQDPPSDGGEEPASRGGGARGPQPGSIPDGTGGERAPASSPDASQDPGYAEGPLPLAHPGDGAGERDDEEWEAIARQLEAELATLEKQRGEGAGRLTANLALANRSRVDYADFLRRFATRAEEMKVNDEEFDYVFYTYGLARYGNMPLVEPLEYKEDERAREFVIAIDTSGSCSSGLTRLFLTRTYEILSQAGRGGERTNIHIVQCDADVQGDTVIESIDDLREFERGLEVGGLGGTDFRPVFAYVDELVAEGAFEDLRGLIYFTDGFGTFPDRAPGYDTVFVFVEEEGRERRVPPWAMKIIMDEESITEMGQ